MKEKLEAYRSKKQEIVELESKLKNVSELCTGNSVVFDYRNGFPKPQSVVGIDEKKESYLRSKWSSRLIELRADTEEVERWIEEIEDSITRRIFRMYYMDGLTQQEVSDRVYIARSKVAKRMSDKLKGYTKDKKG